MAVFFTTIAWKFSGFTEEATGVVLWKINCKNVARKKIREIHRQLAAIGGGLPYPFQIIETKCPDFRKTCPDCAHL